MAGTGGAQVSEADFVDHHHDQMRLQVSTLISTNVVLGRLDSVHTDTTAQFQQIAAMLQQGPVRQRSRSPSIHSQLELAGFNSQTTRVGHRPLGSIHSTASTSCVGRIWCRYRRSQYRDHGHHIDPVGSTIEWGSNTGSRHTSGSVPACRQSSERGETAQHLCGCYWLRACSSSEEREYEHGHHIDPVGSTIEWWSNTGSRHTSGSVPAFRQSSERGETAQHLCGCYWRRAYSSSEEREYEHGHVQKVLLSSAFCPCLERELSSLLLPGSVSMMGCPPLEEAERTGARAARPLLYRFEDVTHRANHCATCMDRSS